MDVHQWCPTPQDAEVDLRGYTVVDQPLSELVWFGPDGVCWRQQRSALLDARRTRQVLADRRPRVFHVYLSFAHEHTGPGLEALVEHLEDFWAGRLHSMASFRIAEYRSASAGTLLMVEEDC